MSIPFGFFCASLSDSPEALDGGRAERLTSGAASHGGWLSTVSSHGRPETLGRPGRQFPPPAVDPMQTEEFSSRPLLRTNAAQPAAGSAGHANLPRSSWSRPVVSPGPSLQARPQLAAEENTYRLLCWTPRATQAAWWHRSPRHVVYLGHDVDESNAGNEVVKSLRSMALQPGWRDFGIDLGCDINCPPSLSAL